MGTGWRRFEIFISKHASDSPSTIRKRLLLWDSLAWPPMAAQYFSEAKNGSPSGFEMALLPNYNPTRVFKNSVGFLGKEGKCELPKLISSCPSSSCWQWRFGVIAGLVACVLIAMPTGDQHGKMVARHQPVTLAAMEGLFKGGPEAELDQGRRRRRKATALAYSPDGTTLASASRERRTGFNDAP
jgi:hypothetical protein